MNFNDFYWHDAIINNIILDRKNPGQLDEINIEIIWPEEVNEKVNFVFENVYWMRMNLNFGIVAAESIFNAVEFYENDEDLKNFYSKWKGAMNDVKLRVFEIYLNSTGGEIKIIAKGFRIEKLPYQT